MWGTPNVPTSSHVPSDETYVGHGRSPSPRRAPCATCARETFRGVITYHSYSQLILYPWGYTDKPVTDPHDRDTLIGLAHQMRDLMKGIHGVVYTAQQSSALYPTAGDTTDWTYGEYGIPSFTIELRPKSHLEGGFILPPSQIQPTWEENRPAAFRFIEQFLEPVVG